MVLLSWLVHDKTDRKRIVQNVSEYTQTKVGTDLKRFFWGGVFTPEIQAGLPLLLDFNWIQQLDFRGKIRIIKNIRYSLTFNSFYLTERWEKK